MTTKRSDKRTEKQKEVQIKKGADAKKKGKKGGQAKSKKKTFARVKNCTKNCPHYEDKCPMIPISETQHKGKCAVKSMSPENRAIYERLLLGDAKGMDEQSALLLFAMNAKISIGSTIKDMSIVQKANVDTRKATYGDKQEIEHKGDVIAPVIALFDSKQAEEIKKEDKKKEAKN